MAKPCPACARPNADAALKCLYCSAALEPPPLDEPESEAPSSLAAPPAEGDWHLIIFIPVGPPDESMIEALADAASISLYEARLALTPNRPRVFRRVEGEFFAQGLSEQLGVARVPHYVVSEKSILEIPISRAGRADLKERHLEVSVDGRTLSIPYQEVLLLVRGEITRENHNENKLTSRTGAHRSLSPGLLLHLYSHDASLAVEIDPESFTWPGLDDDPTRSALLNLERLLDVLEEKTPGVPVDRGFDLEPPVLSRTGADDSDLAQILSGSTSGGVVYDNIDQFRFYARWRGRLERHVRRAAAQKHLKDGEKA